MANGPLESYLVVGPEAGHLGVHHTSNNGSYKPEIRLTLLILCAWLVWIKYPASRASSLFISSTGFMASHLARSAFQEIMRFHHKVIILEKGLREHLNALNPGIGLSGKLGNSSLLLRGLGINCSKRSLEKNNIEL